MPETYEKPTEYVLDILASTDTPFSAEETQPRIADEGLDATTSAINTVCDELCTTGELESVMTRHRNGIASESD